MQTVNNAIRARQDLIKSNILRGFGMTLEKGGGEGSKGGHIIGHTASGKPIYESGVHTNLGYKKQDHEDAFHAHAERAKYHDDRFSSGKGNVDTNTKQGNEHQQKMLHHESVMAKHFNKFATDEEQRTKPKATQWHSLQKHVVDNRKKDGPTSVKHYNNGKEVEGHDNASFKKAIENDFEKGQINDTMLGYDSKIQFKKKGADIITMLNASATSIAAKIKDIESQIETKQEEIGDDCTPTMKCDTWRMGAYKDKINCPYKIYDWNQTYYGGEIKSISDPVVMQGGESVTKSAVTKESAKLCSEYNGLVGMWIEMKVDAEAINVLVNNIDPKASYDLSAKQLAAIQM